MRKNLIAFYEAFCPYDEEELSLAMQVIEFSLDGVSLEDTPKMLYFWINESIANGDYEDYNSVNVMQVVKDKIASIDFIKGVITLRSKLNALYGYNVVDDEYIAISDEGIKAPFCVSFQLFRRMSEDIEKAVRASQFKEMKFLRGNMMMTHYYYD